MFRTLRTAAIVLGCLGSSGLLSAADWPVYLHDVRRSGVSAERLDFPLSTRWIAVSPHPPQPAWSPPIPRKVEGVLEEDRQDDDHAFQLVIAGGRVYYGSSADNTLYCRNLDTGRILWTFVTGGPVRYAPAVVDGRAVFGSDDGLVYCLDAATGRLLWRARPGPAADRQIGNGRLISRWPVRTGVAVDSGVVYAGAGIFPYEGVCVAALDFDDGRVLWRNATMGDDDANRSDFSPQGYMLLSKDTLFVPTGRSMPAAFRRTDGAMLYQARASWRGSGITGGCYALLVDDHVVTGVQQNVAIDTETGRVGFAWFPGHRMVVDDGRAYMVTGEAVMAIDRETYAAGSRRLHEQRTTMRPFVYNNNVARNTLRREKRKRPELRDADKIARLTRQWRKARAELDAQQAIYDEIEETMRRDSIAWQKPCALDDALVLAGDTLLVGGEDKVLALEADTGDERATIDVDGRAAALAVAGGRLLIGADTGRTYCLAPRGEAPAADPAVHRLDVDTPPFGNGDPEGMARLAAAALKRSGAGKGYALVVGAADGRLPYELAQASELKVYAVDDNSERVAAARRRLLDTGLYGVRVNVDDAGAPLPNYFANLAVVHPARQAGNRGIDPRGLCRVLRPGGGTLIAPYPGTDAGRQSAEALAADIRKAGYPAMIEDVAGWTSVVVVRPPLEGGGQWTHQYAEPGNTACGEDRIVRAPLRVLWYGEPGPTRMISRHASAAAPLSVNGRLFVQGSRVVMAYDAYNGARLWSRDIRGAHRGATKLGEASNLCADERSLFVAVGDACLRLDAATGETLKRYPTPVLDDGKDRNWGYIAVSDGVLVGSARTISFYGEGLFGIDVKTGRVLWTYRGSNISHVAIAIDGGRVFFVDASITADQREELLKQDKSRLKGLTGKARAEAERELKARDVRLAVALDLRTGEKAWQRPLDLTDCSGVSRGGGELCLMASDGLLVFSGASANGHYWGQFIEGEFADRRITVASQRDGAVVWSKPVGYRIRPIVVGDRIVAEPWAFDLRTGDRIEREHPITGFPAAWQFERQGHHCGAVSATENLLMFRSGYTAFYDLVRDYGTLHFGSHRLGCWINAIAAGGLVLMPEATAGCQCLYAVQTTVVMEPAEDDRTWGIFSSPGPFQPVKHLAINFGGPGDRRGNEGGLWLSCPRPATTFRNKGKLAVPLDPELTFEGGRKAFAEIADMPAGATGTVDPWIFASGARGMKTCSAPVLDIGGKPGRFVVTLYLQAPENGRGESVVDIHIQGRPVARGVRIAGADGGIVIRRFEDIRVERRSLDVSLAPGTVDGKPSPLPVWCALRIERTDSPPSPLEVVGRIETPLEPYNAGYWAAELVRRGCEADIAIVPAAMMGADTELYRAGEVTRRRLRRMVGNRPIGLYRIAGEELLRVLTPRSIADRFNPLYRSPVDESLAGLYASGVAARWQDPKVAFDIEADRRYTVAIPWPLGTVGAPESIDADHRPDTPRAPFGLRPIEARWAEATTGTLVRRACDAGAAIERRFAAPDPAWEPWRKSYEAEVRFDKPAWPDDLPTVTLHPEADAAVFMNKPDRALGELPRLNVDGGLRQMNDATAISYLRFALDVPGRPVAVKLRCRIRNGSKDAGRVRLVEVPWSEKDITWNTRVMPGRVIGRLGEAPKEGVLETRLVTDLRGQRELSIALTPTTLDGYNLDSREGEHPPELIVAYEKD